MADDGSPVRADVALCLTDDNAAGIEQRKEDAISDEMGGAGGARPCKNGKRNDREDAERDHIDGIIGNGLGDAAHNAGNDATDPRGADEECSCGYGCA